MNPSKKLYSDEFREQALAKVCNHGKRPPLKKLPTNRTSPVLFSGRMATGVHRFS